MFGFYQFIDALSEPIFSSVAMQAFRFADFMSNVFFRVRFHRRDPRDSTLLGRVPSIISAKRESPP